MTYEFRCRSCEARFEVRATLAEKERGLSPHCPQCGSADAQRIFGTFLVLRGSSGGSASVAPDGDGSASGGCACGGSCSCSL